jgi:hypothetical protein
MTDPIKRGGGAGPVDPSSLEGGGAAGGPRTEGFREALGSSEATSAASTSAASTSGTQSSADVTALNQLAESVRAGNLSPEQVVDALVARQLQSRAAQMLPPTQRAELESLLRSRLSDDPMLLALGRDLSRGR